MPELHNPTKLCFSLTVYRHPGYFQDSYLYTERGAAMIPMLLHLKCTYSVFSLIHGDFIYRFFFVKDALHERLKLLNDAPELHKQVWHLPFLSFSTSPFMFHLFLFHPSLSFHTFLFLFLVFLLFGQYSARVTRLVFDII